MKLHPAEEMWSQSNHLLDIMLGVDEMAVGKGNRSRFDHSLHAIVDELSEWGMGSRKEFDANVRITRACQDVLRLRDGYAAWGKPGQTVDDLYTAFHVEYENLRKILAHSPEADYKRAKEFSRCLNQWCSGEVMDGLRRSAEERHPHRRYVA